LGFNNSTIKQGGVSGNGLPKTNSKKWKSEKMKQVKLKEPLTHKISFWRKQFLSIDDEVDYKSYLERVDEISWNEETKKKILFKLLAVLVSLVGLLILLFGLIFVFAVMVMSEMLVDDYEHYKQATEFGDKFSYGTSIIAGVLVFYFLTVFMIYLGFSIMYEGRTVYTKPCCLSKYEKQHLSILQRSNHPGNLNPLIDSNSSFVFSHAHPAFNFERFYKSIKGSFPFLRLQTVLIVYFFLLALIVEYLFIVLNLIDISVNYTTGDLIYIFSMVLLSSYFCFFIIKYNFRYNHQRFHLIASCEEKVSELITDLIIDTNNHYLYDEIKYIRDTKNDILNTPSFPFSSVIKFTSYSSIVISIFALLI
jgi:hypothetical protein